MDDHRAARRPSDTGPGADARISPDEYRASFGEDLRHTLDLNTWLPGEDLARVYGRLAEEVRAALAHEEQVIAEIRARVFPCLADYPGAPPGAGKYEAKPATLERIHRGLLFNGGVEGCDGTIQPFDTLPLTIFQVGVSLVSYQGNQGTWSQRLFRRDLRLSLGNPAEEMIELLSRRERRGGLNQPSRHDQLSELAQRGVMAYAERAILLHRSSAPWRMGHGNPAPFELLTGSGNVDLMIEGTRLIRELIEGHQKFVFVSSEPADRVLLTIGQALRPLEFAVVGSLKERIEPIVANWDYHHQGEMRVDPSWDGEKLTPDQWIRRFRDEVAPRVVYGVYRATRMAPPHLFYAHADHVELAGHIALADSVLQEHRGFPMLIDLANGVCGRVFGRETLVGPASAAYAEAGAPFRYLSERATRVM